MTGLPEMLSCGEKARLIPVVADTSREVRAVSIILSAMASVPSLARVLLESVEQRYGARANLDCFTEVGFQKCPEVKKSRPDGFILLDGGRGRKWGCLVEAKIGRAELEPEQIIQYAHLAKMNDLDAILTISNQFSALPSHHPLRLSKSALKGVDVRCLSLGARTSIETTTERRFKSATTFMGDAASGTFSVHVR